MKRYRQEWERDFRDAVTVSDKPSEESKNPLDDKKTHLIITKIEYIPGADDNITFYFDPDLSKPESEQSEAGITYFTGNAAFDSLRIRNNHQHL